MLISIKKHLNITGQGGTLAVCIRFRYDGFLYVTPFLIRLFTCTFISDNQAYNEHNSCIGHLLIVALFENLFCPTVRETASRHAGPSMRRTRIQCYAQCT